MNVLIIGGSGFIGRHLCEQIAKNGHNVTATYRNGFPNSASAIVWMQTNLPDLQDKHFEGVDVVINLAATSSLSLTKSVRDYIDVNIVAVENICRLASRHSVRKLIHFSSVSAVGNFESGILKNIKQCNDPDIYAATKFMGEKIVAEYDGVIDHVIIRPPGVVGKGYYSCWVGRVLKSLKENSELIAYNKDALFNNIVDISYITNLCDYLIQLKNMPKILTLGAIEPVTVHALITRMRAIVNSKSNVRFMDDVNKNAFYIDVSDLIGIGFIPPTTLEIVENYVQENIINAC